MVLAGACQFGHGVGGFTTSFLHSFGHLASDRRPPTPGKPTRPAIRRSARWRHADSRRAIDLASGLSAVTLASFGAWATADGRGLDWSPTSEVGFLQRALALAVELTTGVLLPAELKVTDCGLVRAVHQLINYFAALATTAH